jgi:hypothetical protein
MFLRQLKKLMMSFVFELLVFHRVVVEEETTKPLIWWKENALKFPNVAFIT